MTAPTTATRPVRILIVDEEEALADVVSLAVGFEGWMPRVASDGAAALAAASDFAPDIVLLDMTLPDMPGTDVARGLRAAGFAGQIVFLTGRDAHEDRLAGYAAGADDYVTKPFGVEELIDHLQPVVRRLGLAPSSRRVGDLVVDASAGAAWRDGEYLPLNPLEFEVLRTLVERAGSRQSIGELLRAAAVRGIRVPRELMHGLVERVLRVVNGDRSVLVRGDEFAGWVLAEV
jgi:two-component system, OmpR family, response regulator